MKKDSMGTQNGSQIYKPIFFEMVVPQMNIKE
jgi:hypothetical protein